MTLRLCTSCLPISYTFLDCLKCPVGRVSIPIWIDYGFQDHSDGQCWLKAIDDRISVSCWSKQLTLVMHTFFPKGPRISEILHFHGADISEVHIHDCDLLPTWADSKHLGTIPMSVGIKLCLGDAGLSKHPSLLKVLGML